MIANENKNKNFNFYLDSYRYSYLQDKTLRDIEFLSQTLYSWKNESNKLWLLYMTMLLEKQKDINNLAERYIYFFKYQDVELFPAVAHWFMQNNYQNDLIEKSSNIYKKIIKSKQENNFYKLVKGKKIAIVGNGPFQIGKNTGEEIDKHDVVIRFNEFYTKGYEKDYGTKTDVWATYLWNPDFLSYEERPDCKLNLWTNYNLYLRKQISIDNLISCIDKNWDFVSSDIPKYIWNDLNISYTPTCGFSIIIYIYKLLGSFKNVDFYGFKFLEEEGAEFTHYFKEKHANNKNHAFEDEAEFLKKFIKMHGGSLSNI